MTIWASTGWGEWACASVGPGAQDLVCLGPCCLMTRVPCLCDHTEEHEGISDDTLVLSFVISLFADSDASN